MKPRETRPAQFKRNISLGSRALGPEFHSQARNRQIQSELII